MRQEAFMACFKLLSRHFPGRTEENSGNIWIARFPIETRTRGLPSAKQECHTTRREMKVKYKKVEMGRTFSTHG